MKYAGMQAGMWALYSGSFCRQLTETLGLDRECARAVRAQAKSEYRGIIARLPEFEKGDRFKMNIVNCALLCAFLLHMPERPDVSAVTEFYAKAVMTPVTRLFCRVCAKSKFSPKDIAHMEHNAAFRAADRNPYSWNMELYPYADGSGYEARFTQCGICALTRELGLYDLTPAMCRLDYTMAQAGGACDFVREYTLASGGPYCDCGYKRKR